MKGPWPSSAGAAQRLCTLSSRLKECADSAADRTAPSGPGSQLYRPSQNLRGGSEPRRPLYRPSQNLRGGSGPGLQLYRPSQNLRAGLSCEIPPGRRKLPCHRPPLPAGQLTFRGKRRPTDNMGHQGGKPLQGGLCPDGGTFSGGGTESETWGTNPAPADSQQANCLEVLPLQGSDGLVDTSHVPYRAAVPRGRTCEGGWGNALPHEAR